LPRIYLRCGWPREKRLPLLASCAVIEDVGDLIVNEQDVGLVVPVGFGYCHRYGEGLGKRNSVWFR
jgi:hypothetical protein